MKIDLNALRQSAERTDSETAVVSRSWLRAVYDDLTRGPELARPADRVPPGTILATIL